MYRQVKVGSMSLDGTDTIEDFGNGRDYIRLDRTHFDVLTSAVGKGFSNAREFAVVSADNLVTNSNAFIIYSSSTGNLFYNENGSASGFGDGGHIAVLENAPRLFGSDFHIVD